LLLAIIVSGAALRAVALDAPFAGKHAFNEAHYSMNAVNFFRYGPFSVMGELGMDLSRGIVLQWLIFLSFILFGVSELSARLPVFVCGVLSLPLLFAITERLFERRIALLAAFFAAFAPGIVYFSRNVQLEPLMVMLLLSALLFMVVYKKGGGGRWLWLSAAALALATLTKFTAALAIPSLLALYLFYNGPPRQGTKLRGALLVCSSAAVAFLWVAGTAAAGLNSDLAHLSSNEWSAAGLATSLAAVALYLPVHLGPLTLMLLVAGLPFCWREMDRAALAALLLFALAWYAIIAVLPGLYPGNEYYDYPGWYALCALAAFACLRFADFIRGLFGKPAAGSILAAIVLATLMVDIPAYFSEVSYLASGRPDWVESAALVAKANTGKQPTLADTPQAMYYAGGDPAYIDWFLFRCPIEECIAGRNYTYVVLSSYCSDEKLLGTLVLSNYTQIAQCAWMRGSAG